MNNLVLTVDQFQRSQILATFFYFYMLDGLFQIYVSGGPYCPFRCTILSNFFFHQWEKAQGNHKVSLDCKGINYKFHHSVANK